MYERKDLLGFVRGHEGLRQAIYLDSRGIATVGIGHALGHVPVPSPARDIFPVATAAGLRPAPNPGVIDRPLPVPLLETLFADYDLQTAEGGARHLARENGVDWNDLSAPQQMALVGMCYQLGAHKLGLFRRMWAALARGDLAEAQREALDSAWADQTPERARATAAMLGRAP